MKNKTKFKIIIIVFIIVLGVSSLTYILCQNYLFKPNQTEPTLKEEPKINDVISEDNDNNNEDNENNDNVDNTLDNNASNEIPEISKEVPNKNTEDNSKNTTSNNNKTTTNNNNKQNNSSTSKNEQPKETSPKEDNNITDDSNSKQEEQQEKSIVKTEQNVEELELQLEKYGTKIYTARYYDINTYNDGTTDKTLKHTVNNLIDTKGFNGTASSMLEEAKALVKENMNKYNELLGYVNGYRKEVNAKELVLDYDLSVAATIRAMEMAYTRPNGSSCFTILKDLSYNSYYTVGENIAAGYNNPQTVATGWRNSKDGHYENMINSEYTKIGLGMMTLKGTSYGTYWAQLFVG